MEQFIHYVTRLLGREILYHELRSFSSLISKIFAETEVRQGTTTLRLFETTHFNEDY